MGRHKQYKCCKGEWIAGTGASTYHHAPDCPDFATIVFGAGEDDVADLRLGRMPEPEPPRDARKAEDWEREDATLVWQTPRCRECNNPMWTREPAKHDLCEECGWLIRDSMQQLATQQRQERSDRIINPFDGSVFAGQTGSLPTQKG